jgi:hypothetical protein
MMNRPGLTSERLAALAALGAVLLTPPFLGIFNVPRLMLGVPLLALYLFLAWLVVIGLVARIVAADDDEEGEERGRDPGPPAAGR